MKKLFVIAGEASGDLHGKNLVKALKTLHPDLEIRGVGGDGLSAQGMSLVRHIRDTNFMGFVEVLKNIRTIQKLFADVKKDLLSFKPDAVLLIDYPGFNLRMARFCKENGIKVAYYISPQIWAWKKSRIKQIKAYVDLMMVILPFEKPFYEKEGYSVDFVGHPLLDEIGDRKVERETARGVWGLKPGQKLVAVLPGSRKQEVSRMLPVMLRAAAKFPEVRFVVAGAPSLSPEFYQPFLTDTGVEIVFGKTYEVLSAADAAMVTSGTATLETALFGVPEVVCYAGSAISIQLARWLIQVRFISLVNLIMDREVVKELIQKDLAVENLGGELKQLLYDAPRRDKMLADYQELRARLGEIGASTRAATAVSRLLGPSSLIR